jgi:hypothetical protein
MLSVLAGANGRPVPTQDMADQVSLYGGDAGYIHDAAKHLRDRGVLVVSVKARHLSTWTLATEAEQIEFWENRVRKENFSELVSQARALSSVIRSTRNRVVSNAIALGVDMGLSAAEVLTQCEPVTP